MKAGKLKFQQLLDGQLQYRVPLFQRTYSWKESEWGTLWEDVLEIYAMEDPRGHFIGAIVTQPVSDIAGHATKHLLIDGQQRLTTLLIMLTSIRRKARMDRLEQLANEIWERCLVNKFVTLEDAEGTSFGDFLKLRPTQSDRDQFADVVERNKYDGTGRIFEAFTYYRQRIDEGDLEGNPLDLKLLKSCVTDRLELVSINLGEADSPHRIFESLNNTGMRLGPSDLIRNLIFMNIPTEVEAQQAYDEHWFPMQETTGTSLDDFFWRFLMMNGSLPRWDETFDEVKKRFVEEKKDPVDTLVEYSRFSRYYRWIGEVGNDKSAEMFRQPISRLNLWEVNVSYPFLMKAFDWVARDDVAGEHLVLVMEMIESFVVRRSVCSVPTNRLRRTFAGMSDKVEASEFVDSSREYLLGEQWPSDDEFRDSFQHYRAYAPQRLARTRLILDSLEDSYGHKESPGANERISIEHIMPQTLSSDWENMLGAKAPEVHERWLHTPGNLTLTGYNPELGNAGFAEKKKLLKESNFSLTEGVLNESQWDEDAIKARGAALAERAVKIWRREGGAD